MYANVRNKRSTPLTDKARQLTSDAKNCRKQNLMHEYVNFDW